MAKIDLHISADGVDDLHQELNKLLAGAGQNSVSASLYNSYGQPMRNAATAVGSVLPAVATSEEDNVAQQVAAENQAAAASTVEPAAEPEKKTRKPRTPKAEKAVAAPEPETEATKKQDAEDEAAESAGAVTNLTHDDIRQALSVYVKKFGLPATQEDGPKLFGLVFPDAGVVSVGQIPNTPEALAKALAGVQEMTEKNPFKREPVKAGA